MTAAKGPRLPISVRTPNSQYRSIYTMPTIQVSPTASELLQDVADALGKAKKVVVVTGAGISTNSGIPDFRSEHGLYSLIQAQFEKASVEATYPAPRDDIEERASKRRRISRTHAISMTRSSSTTGTVTSVDEETVLPSSPLTDRSVSRNPGLDADGSNEVPEIAIGTSLSEGQNTPTQANHDALVVTTSEAPTRHPSIPRNSTECSSSSESNDTTFSVPRLSTASSQTDDLAISSDPTPQASSSNASTPKKIQATVPFSSSPLSSPPPILFDPYDNANQSTEASSRVNSDSDASESGSESDSEDASSSYNLVSSQTPSNRLRNMKGRDLFDSNIWADPVKTSVFYRFATTLRQRVKTVEPTTTHHFIAQLRDVGKLARVYTQNIDEIEKKIGLSTDLKSGAGNKRRKSAKLQQQQTASEQEKNEKNGSEHPKREEDAAAKETAQPSSQASDECERSRPRILVAPDKGVECVFLHGSLHALRCFVCGRLCDWDEDGRESCTMSGEQPECPHCAGATAARQEKGKRALGVGKLRPDIVLYGEEHPQSDLISPIVQHDLAAGPDLLLVLGTSLKVHGLKVMVREFAKAVHTKGGKVVFINFTKPSESTWGDVIDYWIEWDCDAWVDDLKGRKPALWMSPEDIQKEKQRRGELAEKRRESAIKKRESLAEKKKDANADKKKGASHQKTGATNRKSETVASKNPEVTADETPIDKKSEASFAEEPAITRKEKVEIIGDKEPEVTGKDTPELTSSEKLVVATKETPDATEREETELTGEQPAAINQPIPEITDTTNSESEMVGEKELEANDDEKSAATGKKQSGGAKRKRESTGTKRRETIQLPAEPRKKRRLDEDTHCAAYHMDKINKAFQMIRGEPFDYFGYTPSTPQVTQEPQSGVKVAPKKRARKSAPAVLGDEAPPAQKPKTTKKSEAEVEAKPKAKAQPEFNSKSQFRKAAMELSRCRTPNRMQRLAELQGSISRAQTPALPQTGIETDSEAKPEHLEEPMSNGVPNDAGQSQNEAFVSQQPPEPKAEELPVIDSGPSIVAAVKSNPRTRKPSSKKLQESQPIRKSAQSRASASTSAAAIATVASTASASAFPPLAQAPAIEDREGIYIAPLRLEPKAPAHPRIMPMEPEPQLASPCSPLVPEPNQSRPHISLATLSPTQRDYGLFHINHPMRYSFPLGTLVFGPPIEPPPPPPNPNDQLAREAEAAAMLGQLRQGWNGDVRL